MSSRRLVAIPLVLLTAVTGGVFTLAKLHLARPATPAATPVVLGDAAAGKTVFAASCAACHGQGGVSGGVGPKLAGLAITLQVAKAQIDAGGGVMPGGLVKGAQENDLLAYLATILAKR